MAKKTTALSKVRAQLERMEKRAPAHLSSEQIAAARAAAIQLAQLSMEHLPEGQGVLLYEGNNSGGQFWFSEADIEALAAQGWNLHWAQPGKKGYSASLPLTVHNGSREPGGLLEPCVRTAGLKYLGMSAVSFAKAGYSREDLIAEWHSITGTQPHAKGCRCCGEPHSFTWYRRDGSIQR